MLSSNNLRSPASGKVLTVPSQDMVFGSYYLTTEKGEKTDEAPVFADFDDAILAIDMNRELDLQQPVIVRVSAADANVVEGDRRLFRVMTARGEARTSTTPSTPPALRPRSARIIFNRQCLPADYPFINYKMVKSDIGALVNDCCDRYPLAEVEPILDAIKETGFHYATLAGLTVSGLGRHDPGGQAAAPRGGPEPRR